MIEQLEDRQLVGVHEMARILQVPESWLYRKTRFHEIPCVRIGKYVRFEPDKVIAHFREELAHQKRALGASPDRGQSGGSNPVDSPGHEADAPP